MTDNDKPMFRSFTLNDRVIHAFRNLADPFTPQLVSFIDDKSGKKFKCQYNLTDAQFINIENLSSLHQELANEIEYSSLSEMGPIPSPLIPTINVEHYAIAYWMDKHQKAAKRVEDLERALTIISKNYTMDRYEVQNIARMTLEKNYDAR